MKKIFAVIMCALLMLSISGCGKEEPAPENKPAQSEPVKQEPEQTEEIEQPAPVSGEELIEKVEKLENIENPEEREALLAEIQTILEQAEKEAK